MNNGANLYMDDERCTLTKNSLIGEPQKRRSIKQINTQFSHLKQHASLPGFHGGPCNDGEGGSLMFSFVYGALA